VKNDTFFPQTRQMLLDLQARHDLLIAELEHSGDIGEIKQRAA